MKDPLPKNFNNNQRYSSFQQSSGFAGKSHGGHGSNQTQMSKKKSDYCWNFNKGVPCRFGNKCKFIERCKYCDSPSHGVNTCVKLQKKLEGSNNSTGRPVQESKGNEANK